jgi:hypothetical protein
MDGTIFLGLSGLLGCAALILTRAVVAPRLLAAIAAASFGTAAGLRAVLADSPLPATIRFVAMASFSAFAFHRSWCWIRQILAHR